ncbi:MAG: MFS transporter [Chloroflexi bacterium]|nr:MFS transporter [Chloroflexota bacterium]
MHPPRFRRLASVKAAMLNQTRYLPAQERVFRTNFTLHVLNGAFGGLGDALTGSALIMTAFLSQLTTSNLLIALLPPLRDAGWYLPQFFMAPLVDRARRKVALYRASTVFRMAAWLAMVVCIFTIQDHNILLIAVFACTIAISLLAGFAALPFLILTAKVIPPDRRGLVFGLRQLIGGVLGVAAGGAVSLILGGGTGLQFPHNYAVVLAGGAIGYALSYIMLGFTREEPDEAPAQTPPMLANLKKAWFIARSDRQYQRYIVMRVALLVAAACMPFLTVFAKRTLAVSDAFIGTLISVTLASSLLSNMAWARVSDRRGNRLVMIIAASMGLAFCALAALTTGISSEALNSDAAHLALVALFAISGAMIAGINLASNPLMIEIASPDHQSLYIGLSNSILGVVLLLTTLVGLIVDRFGFVGLFVFSGLAFAVALERLTKMREPRAA